MDKIDNIKNLYNKIKDKPVFHQLVASEFGVKEVTVRVGWFYKFDLPSKYQLQKNLITFMQNYIIQQSIKK